MIDIQLNDKQSGYDIIGDYIRRYWQHNIYDTVIVSLGTSYDGTIYELKKEIASPYNSNDIEYLYDWWEGEKYIKLFGIKSINELDIFGGIYTDEKVTTIKSTNKLAKEDFCEKYCRMCGSQRCGGIDTEWFNGCMFKEELKK